MACKKVPIWNVDQDAINDVLGDTNIKVYTGNRNIDFSNVFASPEIVASYIDPDWCAGNNDAERLSELSVVDPISAYDYIEYGGCDEALPEIYFSDLRGWGVDDVNVIGENPDDFIGTFPIVPLYPDPNMFTPYYNNVPAQYPGDPNAYYAGAYFRDVAEYLQKYGASSKVKVDDTNPLPDNVNFKLKITIVLADDYLTDDTYFYPHVDTTGITPEFRISPAAMAAGPTGAVLLDYFAGPLNTFLLSIKLTWLKYLGQVGLTAGIMYIAMRLCVFLADIIYDAVTEANLNLIENGWKVWRLTTGGNYNNYDIRESSTLFNRGVYKTSLNPTTEVISKNGSYFSQDYNYNSLNLDEWFNFETRQKGNSFDKMSPPPATLYIVEIVPVSNCKVSANPKRPHVIGFVAVPDKYTPPNFDVIPGGRICKQFIVKLQDAAHADFIYMQDLERPDGLFESYDNIVFNTANYKTNEYSIYVPPTGEDIILKNIWLTQHIGRYDVLFMKEVGEREQQLIFNKTCIDRGYGDDPYNTVKKYWDLGTNWISSGGAFYRKDSVDTQITQYLPGFVGTVNWDALFKFDIEIVNSTAGKAYLNLTGLFHEKLCEGAYVNGGDNPKNVRVTTLALANYPTGVTLSNWRVYFNGNGKYTIFIQGGNNKLIDRILKLGATTDFNGGISTVTLQRQSPYSPTLPVRAVPMYSEIIDLQDCNLPSYVYLLVDGTNPAAASITLNTIGTLGAWGSTLIDWGDGSPVENVLSNLFNHSYVVNGSITKYLIKIGLPGGLFPADVVYHSLTVNNAALIDFADYFGKYEGGTVNLSGCNLVSSSIIDLYTTIYTASNYIPGFAPDGTHSLYFNGEYSYVPIISRFVGVKKLEIQNNPISNDIEYLGNVSEYIDISNTSISGDLSELSTITDTIKANNCKIYKYTNIVKMRCKNIWWQDSSPLMGISSLNDLCRDLYNSSLMGGKLWIASTNPKITDEQILWYIFQLVHEFDWIVVYNGYYITTANEQNYLQTGEDDYIYTDN